jgi:hypothetical protein
MTSQRRVCARGQSTSQRRMRVREQIRLDNERVRRRIGKAVSIEAMRGGRS